MSAVVTVTQHNYEQIKAESRDRLVVLAFGSPDCVPCEGLYSILMRLSGKDFLLAAVDVASQPEIVARHRVEMIPTMIAMRNGSHIGRWNAVTPDQEQVSAWVAEQLAKDLGRDDIHRVRVTPDNYQAVLAESARRLVVLGFVDDHRLLDKYAKHDMGAWLFGHVADTEQNQSLAELHEVEVRPTLVALLGGMMLAHTRSDHATESSLRALLDTLLRVSTREIYDPDVVDADGPAEMPRVPET